MNLNQLTAHLATQQATALANLNANAQHPASPEEGCASRDENDGEIEAEIETESHSSNEKTEKIQEIDSDEKSEEN